MPGTWWTIGFLWGRINKEKNKRRKLNQVWITWKNLNKKTLVRQSICLQVNPDVVQRLYENRQTRLICVISQYLKWNKDQRANLMAQTVWKISWYLRSCIEIHQFMIPKWAMDSVAFHFYLVSICFILPGNELLLLHYFFRRISPF